MDSYAFYHPQEAMFANGLKSSSGSLKPQLLAGKDPVTILVVAPQVKTYHPWRRVDPIFPAMDRAVPTSTAGWVWYTNNSTKGNTLGCVDYVQVCDARNITCWDNSNITHAISAVKSQTAKNALFLLLFGLERSNAYFGMVWNNDLLNETTSAMLFYQDRLHEEQWKVEAEVLFQLSLARIQIDIFDLARGTYKGTYPRTHPQVVNKLPAEFCGVCSMVKFHAEGYTNVNAVAFWGINFLCILVFLASRRCNNAQREEDNSQASEDTRARGELWIIISLQVLLNMWLPLAVRYLYQGTRGLASRIWDWIKNAVHWTGHTKY